MISLKKIKQDLKALEKYDVVVFGSWARNESNPRSDIDIAVISRIKNRDKNKDLWYKLLGKAPGTYDLKVVELLPLTIQMEIVNQYKVVFGDSLDISEYFYHFRKLWKDVEKRYVKNQFVSVKEKRRILKKNKQRKESTFL